MLVEYVGPSGQIVFRPIEILALVMSATPTKYVLIRFRGYLGNLFSFSLVSLTSNTTSIGISLAPSLICFIHLLFRFNAGWVEAPGVWSNKLILFVVGQCVGVQHVVARVGSCSLVCFSLVSVDEWQTLFLVWKLPLFRLLGVLSPPIVVISVRIGKELGWLLV